MLRPAIEQPVDTCGLFAANTVTRIATRKMYIGLFESKLTDKITHRPDLQIISVDQLERVQELIKSRASNGRELGQRGRYIFTGFVACGGCGGPTVAANHSRRIVYQCKYAREYGKLKCKTQRTYSEHLILPPIIEFLTELIQNQIGFHTALDNATAKYGKSITEEAIEAAIQGELASVQTGKERIVDAISLGVLTTEEASVKLTELREQEQRLTIELSSVAEKTAIMAEWQQAIDALKDKDISACLYGLAKQKPVAFRRLLSLVFKPNSLRVRTERLKGNQWVGALESYELTEAMQNETISFETEPWTMGKYRSKSFYELRQC